MDVSSDGDERHDFNRGNNSNETLPINAIIFINIGGIEASSNRLLGWLD